MSECVVYWLHDEFCIEVQKHGYVGISERFENRLRRHKNDDRFPVNFSWKILYRGTCEQCLALEEALRPTYGIGWNEFKGGRAGATAPKSLDQRAKMSASAKARYTNPMERELARLYQKGKHDHRGENNPRHGVVMSEITKRNISAGRVGKGLGNQNWRKRKAVIASTEGE